jgi:DNA-binding transcriptional ArsR family regulator
VVTGVFGSPARDQILGALERIGQSYPRELARLLHLPLVTVQRNVDELERQGMLASHLIGRVRVVELDPTWFAADELRTLLDRLSSADPRLLALDSIRRRPRISRSGSPRAR